MNGGKRMEVKHSATFTEPIAVNQLNLGFPVYAVEYCAATNVLFVAGGGGPAKSGVRNSLIAFKYNSRMRTVREISELSCGDEAPMCMCIHPNQPEYLAVGVNDRCWIVERDEFEKLNLAKSVRTDFASADSYQKIVRFSPDGHSLLTSGNEDHVRIWHFPWLNSTAEFMAPTNTNANAKENKIEDADYDRDTDEGGEMLLQQEQLVAIVTPAAIHVRSRRENQFVATISPAAEYVFRCARFITEKGKRRKKGSRSSSSFLVTVENVKKGNGKPVLCLWKTSSWTRYSSVKLSTRLRVTTMGVSDNGRLIAIGAADGTVAVYDSKLYLYYHKRELHKFIVTSVVVVERGNTRLLITGSGDGGVRVIPIRKGRPWTWLGLLLLMLVLVTLFFFALFAMGFIGDDSQL